MRTYYTRVNRETGKPSPFCGHKHRTPEAAESHGCKGFGEFVTKEYHVVEVREPERLIDRSFKKRNQP